MRNVSSLKHLDLFSGIGGFSLGLEATGGFETVAFCDIEKFPRKILKQHWPHVKQYKDIKELTNERLQTDGIIPIDIITGGYPCQPFSVAGSQRGEKDKRHLWPEMFRLVKECRPTWVIGENVSGHIKLGLDTVLEDLESEGYTTRAFSISASSVGANHKRERVWIVAHSERNANKRKVRRVYEEKKRIQNEHRQNNSDARKFSGAGAVRETSNEYGTNTDSQGLQRFWSECELRKSKKEKSFSWERWWEFEPDVGRVAHGIPKRVDRLKGLGNSLVPAIPYIIGQSILREEYI